MIVLWLHALSLHWVRIRLVDLRNAFLSVLLLLLLSQLFLFLESFLLLLLPVSSPDSKTSQDHVSTYQILYLGTKQFAWSTIAWDCFLDCPLGLFMLVFGTFQAEKTEQHAQPHANDGHDDPCSYFRRWTVGSCRRRLSRYCDCLFVNMVLVGQNLSECSDLIVRTQLHWGTQQNQTQQDDEGFRYF